MPKATKNVPPGCNPPGVSDPRALACFDLRFTRATKQAQVAIPTHKNNGDESKYPTKIGTYTKCVLQDSPCLVNLAAYKLFRDATHSGNFDDFEKVPLGGTRTLNGPEGAYAFPMEGTDGWQFGSDSSPENQESAVIVPPPPALASEAYGTELTELYWCALLRDTSFTAYATDPTAIAAAKELSGMPTYMGPKDAHGKVTPDLLFRGIYQGETTGPYISQLFLVPTNMGAQQISQRVNTYVAGLDYMTYLPLWEAVQNGQDTGLMNQSDPTPRYLHNGRGLASYTHVDELFQAYFTAYLAMETLKIPTNPGSPYKKSKTQNGFGTFGPPDFAATLAQVAKIALNAVWYQKWVVHLRHRPESGGGIVHLIKENQGSGLGGSVNKNVLNSNAVQQSFNRYGSYLLSQAFPEGSPAHPAYPTGHGTVGGACITVLKFFYDGDAPISQPMMPSPDGTSLLPYSYTSTDAIPMTVNGELNKLARNITFGHGIHAGIHWRTDSDASMLLGEAIAISVLQDLAKTYKERFKVRITKLDGSAASISN
jgi:hypothetical protein